MVPFSSLNVKVTVPPTELWPPLTLQVTVVSTLTMMFCGQVTFAFGAPWAASDCSIALSAVDPGICTDPGANA